MNNKNSNTEEILDAIKNMMSDNSVSHEQELPKDVIELTNPLNESNESIVSDSQKLDILELNNPISDKNEEIPLISKDNNSQDITNLVSDEQIRKVVKDAINSLPPSKLDKIINEELEKIIKDKLNSSRIIISSENNK